MHDMWKQLIAEACLKGALRYPSQRKFSPKTMRRFTNQISRIFPCEKHAVHLEPYPLDQLKAEKITPKKQTNKTVIVYLHGGGFCLGSLDTHRAWLCNLAQHSECTVIHIAYPLAPEADFEQINAAIYQAYRYLIDSGINAKDIILAGDDAGANLILALTLRLVRQKNTTLPQALILLSPFLDLTLTSNSIRYNKKHDALMSADFLQQAIDYYLKNSGFETSDPRVSPLFDDLSGLPPLLIQVGSKTLLMDDAKRLKEMATLADVEVSYKLYTGMWHNFFMFNAWFEEGQNALQDIKKFIDQCHEN